MNSKVFTLKVLEFLGLPHDSKTVARMRGLSFSVTNYMRSMTKGEVVEIPPEIANFSVCRTASNVLHNQGFGKFKVSQKRGSINITIKCEDIYDTNEH